MANGFEPVRVTRCQAEQQSQELDLIAIEAPIAISYNGISHAVMLATPTDLEPFAVGFSLTEGIIQSPDQIYGIDVQQCDEAYLVDVQLSSRADFALKTQKRQLQGRTGCGLCGIESLDALNPEQRLAELSALPPDSAIARAQSDFAAAQALQQTTGATHAAALFSYDGELVAIAEDVGRHNALDKLIGMTLSRRPTGPCFVLVSSRASYEMVIKTVIAGFDALVAISAATSLAVREAKARNLRLIGFCRPGRAVIYS